MKYVFPIILFVIILIGCKKQPSTYSIKAPKPIFGVYLGDDVNKIKPDIFDSSNNPYYIGECNIDCNNSEIKKLKVEYYKGKISTIFVVFKENSAEMYDIVIKQLKKEYPQAKEIDNKKYIYILKDFHKADRIYAIKSLIGNRNAQIMVYQKDYGELFLHPGESLLIEYADSELNNQINKMEENIKLNEIKNKENNIKGQL